MGRRVVFLDDLAYLHYGGFDVSRYPLQVAGLRRFVGKFYRGWRRSAALGVIRAGCTARLLVHEVIGQRTPGRARKIEALAAARKSLA